MAERSGEGKYQLVGWILFLLCAVLFIAAALRNGDVILTLASVVFMAACLLFLIPILRGMRDRQVKKHTGSDPSP